MHAIKGIVPMPNEVTSGCRFKTRCEQKTRYVRIKNRPLLNLGKVLSMLEISITEAGGQLYGKVYSGGKWVKSISHEQRF